MHARNFQRNMAFRLLGIKTTVIDDSSDRFTVKFS